MAEGWGDVIGGSLSSSGCVGNLPDGGIEFGGNSEMYCDSNVYTVDVTFTGGVLPVSWATTIGKITPTGARTATVKIHTAVGSPIIFQGYIGDIRCTGACTPPSCNDTINRYAYVRLGKELLDKGIFENCRHHCGYVHYDCHGRPAHSLLCGENAFVIDPNDCPFTFTSDGVTPYGTPGECLGPCNDGSNLNWTFTPVYYFGNSAHYAECGDGLPTLNVSGTAIQLFEASAPIQDARHPNLIAAGCSPCALEQGNDIIITATDAAGNIVIQDIHIN